MVRAAFQKWEDLPRSNVSFTYIGICDGDPSGSREGRRDGLNTIGWADLRISTGAQTALRSSPEKTLRDGQYREILEADIAINISSFSTLTDPVQFVWTTLPHVLVHEIGHLAGLDHSKVECSVMWPTGFRSEFCRDDLDAMAILYPGAKHLIRAPGRGAVGGRTGRYPASLAVLFHKRGQKWQTKDPAKLRLALS